MSTCLENQEYTHLAGMTESVFDFTTNSLDDEWLKFIVS